MSLDSVASESSVQDLQLDTPKIGQLEFGLEYDRWVTPKIGQLEFGLEYDI